MQAIDRANMSPACVRQTGDSDRKACGSSRVRLESTPSSILERWSLISLCPLWVDTVENDFAALNSQHLFKIAAAYAISIQIPCCSDSIVAFGRIADDFFNSIGHKRTFRGATGMSALPPKADMCGALAHVRYGPIADSCTAANRTLNQPPHQRARRRCRGRCPIASSSGRSPIKAVAAGQETPTDCKPSHSESA